MKIILTLLTVIIFPGLCYADCTQKAESAKSFINEYKIFCDNAYKVKPKVTDIQWIQKNTKVTDNFKKAHKKLILDARKKDPEMGLDFDPIFDAQDYPDEGFKLFACSDQSDYVTLNGVDWEVFRVVVKVIKTDKGWLVDGAGVINIPKNKRAKRN